MAEGAESQDRLALVARIRQRAQDRKSEQRALAVKTFLVVQQARILATCDPYLNRIYQCGIPATGGSPSHSGPLEEPSLAF
eukprot:11063449-Karenia_brevis.AAC.1